MTSKIFISYSKKDRNFAWKLADDLVNAGHKIWIDRSLQVGENWELTIEKQLSEANEVIVVLSANSIASKWVQHEGSIAYGLQKRMYPVLIEALPTDELPLWISKFQYHNFVGVEYAGAFQELNAVLTPPNPIQDLLDQQVSAYQQTNALMGDAILRVIEEAKDNLTLSEMAVELIEKSKAAIWERVQREERLKAEKEQAEKLQQEVQKQANLRLRKLNQVLIGLALLAILFAIGAAVFGLQASQQANVSLARSLSSQAKEFCSQASDEMRMRCILLSTESLERYQTSDAILNLDIGAAGLTNYLYYSGYEDFITASSLSPDGRYFATGSKDGIARVVELSSGREVVHLQHFYSVFAITFSSDGRYIASTGNDGTTRIIELSRGKEVARLQQNYVTETVFSPDGSYFAISSNDGKVRVLELSSGKETVRVQHGGSVYTMIFSTDGRYFATGSNDGTVFVTEPSSGIVVMFLQYDNTNVNTITFSPDGRYFATASRDGTARVVELSSGKEVVLLQHNNINTWPAAIVFSPDGHYFAIGNIDGIIGVISLSSGEEVASVQYHRRINAIAFSTDGRFLASASDDGIARVVELSTGDEVARIKHHNYVTLLVYSLDGRYFATGSDDGVARVVDLQSGKEMVHVGHDNSIVSIAFTLDGKYFTTRSYDGTARVVELDSNRELTKLQYDKPIHGIAFSPSGRYLAIRDTSTLHLINIENGVEVAHVQKAGVSTFSLDERYFATVDGEKAVRVVELSSGSEIVNLQQDNFVSIAFTQDGRYIAIRDTVTGAVHVIDIESGVEVARMQFSSNFAITFSPDGRYLATNNKDGTASVVDLSSGKEIERLQMGISEYLMFFSPDGRYIVTSTDDKVVHVVEISNWQEVARVKYSGNISIRFSAEGHFVYAINYNDKTVRVVELDSGDEVAYLQHDDNVNLSGMEFSPNGRYYAISSYVINNRENTDDWTVRVVEISSQEEVARLQHDDYINTIAFSPDGLYFASNGNDNTMRVVGLSSRKEIINLQHEDHVSSMTFSPNGRYLATGSYDGTVQLIMYRYEDMIDWSCSKVQRNLSLNEWDRFVGKDNPYQITCPGKYIPSDAQAELDNMKKRQSKIITGIMGGGALLGLVFMLLRVQTLKQKKLSSSNRD